MREDTNSKRPWGHGRTEKEPSKDETLVRENGREQDSRSGRNKSGAPLKTLVLEAADWERLGMDIDHTQQNACEKYGKYDVAGIAIQGFIPNLRGEILMMAYARTPKLTEDMTGS